MGAALAGSFPRLLVVLVGTAATVVRGAVADLRLTAEENPAGAPNSPPKVSGLRRRTAGQVRRQQKLARSSSAAAASAAARSAWTVSEVRGSPSKVSRREGRPPRRRAATPLPDPSG
ncbi:hypothetical protein [Kitasatospora sp. NPDC056184]|uniref:hypothetical protein n=1 Tax=Kitasatospora sp. NPDC056184 TaxID=3345738 RepID=UPI0035DCC8F2